MSFPIKQKMTRLAFALSMLFAGPAHANVGADQPLVTDRPGIGTGSSIVGVGLWQVETGLQRSWLNNDSDSRTNSIAQSVLRTGLTEDWELDVIWSGLNQNRQRGSASEWSSSDLILGTKYQFHASESATLSVLGTLSIPTGSGDSSSDSYDPQVTLLYDAPINDSLSYSVNLIAGLIDVDGERAVDRQFAVSLNKTLSDKTGVFIELWGRKPAGSNQEEFITDVGVTYLISDNLQVDASVGVGLNDESAHFINMGVAWRM